MPASKSSTKNASRLREVPIEEAAKRLAVEAGLPDGYPLVIVHKRTKRRLTRVVKVDYAKLPKMRAADDVRLSEVTDAFLTWVARENDVSQHKAEVWQRVVPGERRVRRPIRQSSHLLNLQEADARADTHQLGIARAAALRCFRQLAKDPSTSVQEVIGGALSALVAVAGGPSAVKRAAAQL